MNELVHYIQLIWKKKWWVIIPVLLSIIISFILTLPAIKPPLYQATLQFFPTRLPTAFRVTENFYASNLLDSKEIKNAVLEKYDKNTNPNTWFSSFNYNRRIKVEEDQNIVTISVKYEDPKTACEIAQYLVDLYSEKTKQLKHNYHKEHALFYTGMIELTNHIIDSIKNELSQLAKDSNVFVQTYQTQELTRALLGTYDNAPHINKQEVEKAKQTLQNNGATLVSLEAYLLEHTKKLGTYQNEHDLSINELKKMDHYASVFSTTCNDTPTTNTFFTILAAAIVTFFGSIIIILLTDTYHPLFKTLKEKVENKQ